MSLPPFLRNRLTLEAAHAILRQRLERREADFLELVRQAVYDQPASPFRGLLDLAGCECGDLEALVRADGLDDALRVLFSRGVYLTVDEFKGRRPVVRGSSSFDIMTERLRNPLLAHHLTVQSSGSRGRSTPVFLSLQAVRDRAANTLVTLDARGGREWLHASWVTPGAYVGTIVRHAAFGAHLTRWFSLVDPRAPGLHPRYRWSFRALRYGGLLSGLRLPPADFVPYGQPRRILEWLTSVLQTGQTPHLYTYVSAAVRLCQLAVEAGVDLRGVQLTVTGEPLTSARLLEIQRAGCQVVSDYGSIDAGGFVSYGCLAPREPDEVHLFTDLHAMVQPGQPGESALIPSSALLISSLRATSPFILINVSLGDQATIAQRRCGCALEALGWTSHLHTIRSFEKLTAGGVTLLDADVVRVLEETLPARFGGGPTDFQLVEEEAENGQARLSLLASPSLGPLDEHEVIEAFLASVGTGSGAERVAALHWHQAKLVRLVRESPRAVLTGKILHVVASPSPAGTAHARDAR